MSSIITGADSYKFSHFYQDPPGTTLKQSHVVARNIKGIAKSYVDHVTFFGLQAWIKERLMKPFTQEDIEFAEIFAKGHGVPFNRDAWQTILKRYKGYLPVKIRSLPEGSQVPIGVAQVIIENTDSDFPWLTAYIETELLRAVWYPSTVATISRACRKIIYSYLQQTSDRADEEIAFKLHDFGQRGVSSRQSAGLGGMAHLINFMGTDTTEGVLAAMEYYGAGIAGFSIPAMEHSTVTIWGKENESEAFRNMLEKSPGPIVACVSDSYDIYNAVTSIWGEQLRQAVIDSGKTVVVRPDSGDPLQIVHEVIELLGNKFGYTTNNKGYRVLNNVRVIQGDGIDPEAIEQILEDLKTAGWSAENIAFGMGAGLLQNVNRDTFGYANKCNFAIVNGEKVDVFKDPITDHNKRSWKGHIDVVSVNGEYVNTDQPTKTKHFDLSMMETRYDTGSLGKMYTFDEVKQNAR